MSFVYAKCWTTLRKSLWNDLISLSNNIQDSWSVMGDFNVIAEVEEKAGGMPNRLEKSCMGNNYTWCNNRDAPNTIWKRLDRVLYNSEWFDLYNKTIVNHLAIASSDHASSTGGLH
ncbi:hypothetical protein H5410_052649 [Solanum commersonii]|uniref:Uncharacterized protein n=1 Tax=Solanum commersonii TaxID=4109 RepID=A0A9J5X473_SOLCO|nr:hypothetical protein H5410_052649 [Solanum commersonii]